MNFFEFKPNFRTPALEMCCLTEAAEAVRLIKKRRWEMLGFAVAGGLCLVYYLIIIFYSGFRTSFSAFLAAVRILAVLLSLGFPFWKNPDRL